MEKFQERWEKKNTPFSAQKGQFFCLKQLIDPDEKVGKCSSRNRSRFNNNKFFRT